MNSRKGTTKDPSEGIRQVLGKHTKILLKVPVKMERSGGDKTDNRVIVITPHRLYVMTNKIPTKIDQHFHFLDISGIESKKPNQVVFKIHEKTYSFRPAVETSGSEQIDEIIITLAKAVRSIFPGVLLANVIPKVRYSFCFKMFLFLNFKSMILLVNFPCWVCPRIRFIFILPCSINFF